MFASTGRIRRRCGDRRTPVESWKADAVFALEGRRRRTRRVELHGQAAAGRVADRVAGPEAERPPRRLPAHGRLSRAFGSLALVDGSGAAGEAADKGAEPVRLHRHDVAGAGEGGRGSRASRRHRRNRSRKAGENQEMSGLADKPIRWICDDAMKFMEREVRRERRSTKPSYSIRRSSGADRRTKSGGSRTISRNCSSCRGSFSATSRCS